MVDQLDGSKDYYKALGLNHTATVEELKASYINLALLYHPDTATTNDIKTINKEEEFIKISEAWSVLSKPELKSTYDSLRRLHVAKTGGFMEGVPNVDGANTGVISQGFNTQKMNFSKVVQARAASNWQDLQDKYKTEKWQNMPLSERKASRARPLTSAKSSMMTFVLPFVIVGGVAYVMHDKITK